MEMKCWIARDMDGDLHIFRDKPERLSCFFNGVIISEFYRDVVPEITWENSPVEVVFKIEKV